MSTVVAFAPMNLRLYDKDEQDLRTFVSPIFDCTAQSEDGRGMCAHIVADNGGGKSSLLLFFELLFCKPGGNSPSVGKKKVLDYLRRAAFDLHDPTPTTMAALVRRDDAAIMKIARDTIFGYTVRLRDAEGTSASIRRFVIHLSENPSFSLERLAKEVVYDTKGAPRPFRDVCDRLRSVPGCRMYEGSEWDGYAREMIDAGISPILWRELAKMNTDEEAAGTYFQSSDAFRNIVRLVSEAQAPVNGEQAKPLWDVAATIASQVATQAEDRARETECRSAGDAVFALSDAVGLYADAREALKVTEDQAHWGGRALGEIKEETEARIDVLQEKSESYRDLRTENEQRRVSSEIRTRQEELQAQCQTADARRIDLRRKQHAYSEASKHLDLDAAARSYHTYKELDARYRFKRNELEVLKGTMEASEELAEASKRAWRELRSAEWGVRRVLDDAQRALDAARLKTSQTKESHDEAVARWGQSSAARGSAQGALRSALSQLEQLSSKAEGMQAVQKTIDGFYTPQVIEALEKKSAREVRRAGEALRHACEQREVGKKDLETARATLGEARIDLARKQADAKTWEDNLARAEELDMRVRTSLSLWEEPVELIAEGKIGEARVHVEALRSDAVQDERYAREQAAALQRRLDALRSGRLDMSDRLRSWLDQHAIEAKTLASFEGISPADRSILFNMRPWLAHVLVADDRTCATLSQLEDNDLSELGHPVFYMRQSDVYELTKHNAKGPADKTKELVHALHTIEQAYLDDPRAYESRIQGGLAHARSRAEEQRRIVEQLDAARDAIVVLSSFFDSIGMREGTSVSNVKMREESSRIACAEAEERTRQCEERLASLREKLDQLERAVMDADDAERRAQATYDGLLSVRRQNDACIRAKDAFEQAERAYRETEGQKERTYAEWEHARSLEGKSQAEFDRAQRDAHEVDTLRSALEGLSVADEGEATRDTVGESEGRTCTPGELATSINVLRDIISRQNKNLEIAQSELDSLRRQRDEEDRWQQILRGDRTDGVTIAMEEIEAWVPRDEVDRRKLANEKSRARNEKDAADRAYREADNKKTLLEERLRGLFSQLGQLGLREPLEVPKGYDYHATKAAIDADEERNSADLRRVRQAKEHVESLLSRLDRLAYRLSREDGYRAKVSVSDADLVGLDAWDAFVTDLEKAEKLRRGAMEEAKTSLEKRKSNALESVRRTGEISAARGTKESVESVVSSCKSYESMIRVKRGLEDQSMQFKTMAATLQNKLRATNESIDDLVERAVREGYQLLEELHQLVMISRVNITGKSRQRTIDFRSRGRTQFNTAIRQDEVATSRLERYVRNLLMVELPTVDSAIRAERAKTRFEPHELVYVLLDNRSVEVRYPVIRGGKGLSYESARDVTGSGSTGQKSAGYVLAFLALLRYLGSVGSLSSENSLFVALENQFGKISSSRIILDIKEVVDQTHMQLITVAGRELRSAYAMGDVTFTLYKIRSTKEDGQLSTSAIGAQVDESDKQSADVIIDSHRATRQAENLRFDFW